ncbi:NYN domain-containing protein [Patescibacteria group bacterium]|nr:NYN domain-containing protein [Patescibacteria group bacterium]
MISKENNFAFIDGQNLNLGIKNLGWDLDFRKFRVYLKEKYAVSKVYYFIGYLPQYRDLYKSLQKYGYELVFKPAMQDKKGKPKGNVDADLVLKVMFEYNNFDKAIIVSSDGDFYSLIKHLYRNKKIKICYESIRKNLFNIIEKNRQGKNNLYGQSEAKIGI